jgi:hypothetical protein
VNGRQHLLKDDEGLESKTKCLLRENWSRLSVCQMPVFCSYACLSPQEAKWEICLGWYRSDARKLEEWASAQSGTGIAEFASREGDVENILKSIAERAAGKGTFHYSRFFAIGLFRLLECANASDPATLEQLSKALNVSKLSVDRDLDVYRNLLSKLTQGKELLKEYTERWVLCPSILHCLLFLWPFQLLFRVDLNLQTWNSFLATWWQDRCA